ncbi:hypothetical protein ACFL7M_04755 [Thermodesulfobacteriota bacterium]
MAVKHKIRTWENKTRDVKLTPLSAIRAFCLECVCWSPDEVRKCTDTLCPLYIFRFGKNPSRKGIGNQMIGQLSRGNFNENRKTVVNE